MKTYALATIVLLWSAGAAAQVVSHRGHVEAQGFLFPQTTSTDSTQGVSDALLREELFVRPADWLLLAGGLDLRASSHEEVEHRWRVDFTDRGVRRSRLGVRRLSATLNAGRLTVDVGKQVVRWARNDLFNPVDRFAPRDYVNLIRSEVMPVTGLRPSVAIGGGALEAVWTWPFTPSRMPLLDQRWMVFPADVERSSFHDAGVRVPRRTQWGARWTHVGDRLEVGLSYFRGFQHLPYVAIEPLEGTAAVSAIRVFPRLGAYGLDFAVPTRWLSVKAEAAYFSLSADAGGPYLLYAVEVERQAGEWLLTAAYAGKAEEGARPLLAFDPDRGLAPAFIGRASLTVDPRRTLTVEAAARQNGDGQYLKADYSYTIGNRWRWTMAGVILAGNPGDFLGQFNRNSHLITALRFSL